MAEKKSPKPEATPAPAEAKAPAAAEAPKKTGRRKKKRWFPLVAPKIFQNVKIGETLAFESSQLVGKHLKVNLMVLTNDPRKQHTNINFQVASVTGEQGMCKTTGYELHRSHLKRIVRKGTTKIEDSFLVQSQDGTTFRIKPLLVTRFKLHNSLATTMRKRLHEHLIKKFKETKEEELFSAIFSNQLQGELRGALKPLYPISACELRSLELVQPPKSKL